MSKGGIKEVRGVFRDPRAEDTGSRPPVPSARPARPSIHDIMQELSIDLPPPPASDQPAFAGAAAAPVSAPLPPSGLRDPFGIVGTTQAEVFAIENVIAHGGFGVIYKARHVRFRAPVALKCLKIPAHLSSEQRMDFFERFRAEGEVMFRLSGSIPEVVRPIHVDALKLPDGRFVPFIALEWLEGETLKDVIVRRITEGKAPISLPRAVVLLSPVARALARAHHFPGPDGPLAILHCDLKPDNLFAAKTDGGEYFKIFDFGIAKVRSAASRVAGGATEANATSSMFTPAYAAPEQWAPDKYGQTGPWTDVYALALTLVEVVTQKPAIDGAPAAMLAQAMDASKRPTPRRLGLEIPAALDAIFAKALAVDPKDRYQSVEAFWGDLERALQLPSVIGPSARVSVSGMAAVLPPGWDSAEEKSAVSSRQAAPAVLPSLDLDLPPLQPAAPPPPPPRPQASPAMSPQAPALGDLELAMPGQLEVGSPAMGQPPSFAAPTAGFDAGSLEPGGELEAGAFDLVEDPARPAAPAGAAVPPPPSSNASFVPSAAAAPQEPEELGQLAGPAARERLQQAAQKAGAVAAKAASTAAVAAASTAKTLAKKAVEVDASQVRFDDPSTWIRPMRGPIIAMALAIAITIGVVIANKTTGSSTNVSYISLPLLLGAIGFGVYRWMKIQKSS
ncbi:MAG: serine/threonine protein kinase [Myxococcales bacterium]|nr:serine/threonine protein kinase [Myxococcales bacterium]